MVAALNSTIFRFLANILLTVASHTHFLFSTFVKFKFFNVYIFSSLIFVVIFMPLCRVLNIEIASKKQNAHDWCQVNIVFVLPLSVDYFPLNLSFYVLNTLAGCFTANK